ncbi:hypothetical protein BJX68DRAFT_277428 [Aspergillus pseudodeflectus]|uniref:Glycosyltransferase family 28 N-terminal domain-containing protein n=1 Tax=Aspergillus pseudodeflectus TaxID=176178 RepID=A0ABR4JYG1_9EURO
MATGAANIPFALLEAPTDRRRITDDLDAAAHVTDDGRVEVAVNEGGPKAVSLLQALQARSIPVHSEIKETRFPIRLNVVIHVVGSRGDVQPFIALGQALQKHGHRVRLATHLVFRDFVKDNGLEFFNIGGDPAELMSFMVKNPKLMPKMKTLLQGTVGKRRKEIRTMIGGCWRSCFEAGEGTDPTGSDSITSLPFVADAIIANPPSFAHFNCAQKMGVPLHMMFTMPWSPTQAFPHPLANILTRDTKPSVANFLSYVLTEILIWQGVGDLINEFRRFELGLDQLEGTGAPSLLHRLRVPFTYFWSPSLLPKPDDWADHIEVTGFNFLPSKHDYTPPQDLVDFLEAGPPPLYIGFGSIVVDDPDALSRTILEAVEVTGQRAVISKGWGGLGAGLTNQRNVLFLGNCPHDWLFQRVCCVIHHGGAGTTATGVALGQPTIIVPFFGDQPFWGALVAQNGAGPPPIPIQQLTESRLANAIRFCLEGDTVEKAQKLGERIRAEDGARSAVDSFHQKLDIQRLQCALCPDRPAVWRIKKTRILLSAFAATVLVVERRLDPKDVVLYYSKRYSTSDGCLGADAFSGAISNFLTGVVGMPLNAVQNILQPPSERFAASYNMPPHEAYQTMQSSEVPGVCSQAEVTTNNDAGQAPCLSSAVTIQSQVGAPSMATKWGRLKKLGASASYMGRRTLNWMVEVPMGLTVMLSQFFHYLPRGYHDQAVRETPEVAGVKSGFIAAGKEFGYSFYDGITGLVTQPRQGWNDGRFGGLGKGLGKGVGGVLLKPQAGLWGLLGYPLSGIHREIEQSYGANRVDYVVRSRIRQGIAEWDATLPEERAAVLDK